MSKRIVIDIESRSELDLEEVGLDLYARHESTEVQLCGYKIDGASKKLWLLEDGRSTKGMPADLHEALQDPDYIIIAWNAQFERVMFQRVLGIWIPYERWRDPMILAYSLSLPGALEKVGVILKLAPEDMKDPAGEELMKFFSFPAKKSKKHTLFGIESRFNEPDRFPEKWAAYGRYCLQDVHSEEVLWDRMNKSPLPEAVWEEWFLDQAMNDVGMPVNRLMAENALWLAQEHKRRLVEPLVKMTGLVNPLSDKQIKEWLSTRGYPYGTVKADFVRMELANPQSQMTKEAKDVMKLRLEAKKNSASKLETLLLLLGPDDRLRFQFRFMGAARTGRWAGRGMQPQNLPRPIKAVKKNYQRIIDLIMARDYDTIEKEYGSVMAAIVSSIRMVFQATPGNKIDVADLNAIENRGLGYLARCPAILNVFHEKKDPYLAFAVHLFKRTYEDLKAEYDLYEATKGEQGSDQPRQFGKPPVLGGGYALGGGDSYINEFGDEVRGGLYGYALNVCGVDMPKDKAHEAIAVLREAWPEVVQYWKDLEEGFKRVFKKGGVCRIGEETFRKIDDEGRDVTGNKFAQGHWRWVPCENVVPGAVLEIDRRKLQGGGYMIRIKLPSGRRLHYLNVSIEDEPFKYRDKQTGEIKTAHGEVIYYDGIEHSATANADGSRAKKKYKWGRVKTYGGKLTENVVQAFARDLLTWGMKLAVKLGFEIFGVFHDEMAAMSPDDMFGIGLTDLIWCMSQSPAYSPDIPLGAAGFTSPFYRKG